MNNLTEKIYEKVKSIMDKWSKKDIYAVSFFVYSNECFEYKEFSNVSTFMISYNREKDCKGAGPYDEERWNYAFWRQNEKSIIDPDKPDDLIDQLYGWYAENGIVPGVEGEDDDAPAGHIELLKMASAVARRLQEEGYLQNRFGKKIPIIVHGLEYDFHDLQATEKANPYGEAKDFFTAMEELGFA